MFGFETESLEEKKANRAKIVAEKRRAPAAIVAARGGGSQKDLTPIDQMVVAIIQQVGVGKPFKSFDEAYSALEENSKGKFNLPNSSVLKGRALRMIDWAEESNNRLGPKLKKKSNRGQKLIELGIDPETLPSKYGRFASGAAQEINKLDYARGKVANVRNDFFKQAPNWIKKAVSLSPLGYMLGAGQNEEQGKLKEDVDKIFTDEEKFWKGYNSNVDFSQQGGLNLPLNILGGTGGALPDLLAGFGAGLAGKKVATQFGAELLASVGMETAKYQMDGDADATMGNIVSDMFANIVAMRGGSALANSLDATKGIRETTGSMTISDTKAAIEGMKNMQDGKSGIPSLLVSDPAEAVKKIKAPKSKQEALDIKRAFDDAEAKTAQTIDKSLDNISPDPRVIKNNAPSGDVNAQDPTAKAVLDSFQDSKAKFRARAQPFTDAYTEAGKDIEVDINDILQSASNITDPSALTRFESVITGNINRINDVNKIKLMKESNIGDLADFKTSLLTDEKAFKDLLKNNGVESVKELINVKGIGKKKLADFAKQQRELVKKRDLFDNITQLEKKAKVGDMSSFSANDLDIIVKQLGEEISSNKNAMSSLSKTGLSQLDDVRAGLKNKLENLAPEFSDNYKKAKSIYKDGFKVYGKETIIGDVSGALDDFKNTGSLDSIRNIINTNPVFDNLQSYSSILPRDSKAYKSVFREGFDKKLDGVRDAKGGSVFDFNMFGDALKGTNWEELGRFAPKGANKSIDTISGFQSLLARMENKGSELLTNSSVRNEMLDKSAKYGLFNPKAGLKTIKDSLIESIPQVRPWQNETNIGFGANIAGQFDRLLPSASRPFRMESADKEAEFFIDQLNRLRKNKGMSEVVEEPIIPSIFDKLSDIDYDYKK